MNKVKDFSCLIKPVSGRCNLKCTYCFYCDEMKHREIADRGVMSDETMHNLIARALEISEESCTFTFQGGEPTLAGLDFYKNFVAAVKKLNQPAESHAIKIDNARSCLDENNVRDSAKAININYSIQTNGLLVDEEWADFYAENKFLVGLSIDGYREVHDKNRGEGSWNAVKRAAKMLRERGVEYTGLCVVTAELAMNAELAYTTMKKCGFDVMQFIPCIAPFESNEDRSESDVAKADAAKTEMVGRNVPTSRQYGQFLIDLYTLWAGDIQAGNRISIRYFDNLITLRNGGIPESCGMIGECCNQNVIEADGGVYPCDFYVLDEYCMGNVNEIKSEDNGSQVYPEACGEMYAQKCGLNADAFIHSAKLSDECKACDYFNLCRGGCRRERDNSGLNSWCESYRMFFEKIL